MPSVVILGQFDTQLVEIYPMVVNVIGYCGKLPCRYWLRVDWHGVGVNCKFFQSGSLCMGLNQTVIG